MIRLSVYVFCLSLMLKEVNSCAFPEFLVKGKSWKMLTVDGGHMQAIFNRTHIDVATFDGQNRIITKFVWKCKTVLHKIRYTLMRVISSAPNYQEEFICMEINERSSYVAQIRKSGSYRKNYPSHCHDYNLRAEPHPMISVLFNSSVSIRCPFIGGFAMQMTKPDGTELCPMNNTCSQPRMESECTHGMGIEFDFRRQNCIPRTLKFWKIQQKLKCVANLTDESNRVILVLKSNGLYRPGRAIYWCLHLSGCSDTKNHIKGYLYADSCHMQTNKSNSVIQLKGHNSLALSLTTEPRCEKFSNRCDRVQCTFSEDFIGNWKLLTSQNSNVSYVKVSPYFLFMPNGNRYKCLGSYGVHHVYNRTLLLRILQNGCISRFACVEIITISKAIKQIRIGKEIELYTSQGVDEWKICEDMNFQKLTEIGNELVFKEIPKMTILHHTSFSSSCQIPKPFWMKQFPIYYESDSNVGCVSYISSSSSNIIDINSKSGAVGHSKYRCLAFLEIDRDNITAMITTNLAKHPVEYLCIVFLKTQQELLILDASNCNDIDIKYSLQSGTRIKDRFRLELLEYESGKCSFIYQKTTPAYRSRNGATDIQAPHVYQIAASTTNSILNAGKTNELIVSGQCRKCLHCTTICLILFYSIYRWLSY